MLGLPLTTPPLRFNYLQRVRCGGVRYYSALDGGPPQISEAEYEQTMARMENVDRPVILSAENKRVEDMNEREFQRLGGQVERTMHARDYLVRRSKLPDGRIKWTNLSLLDPPVRPEEDDIEKVSKSWRLMATVMLKVSFFTCVRTCATTLTSHSLRG